MPCPSNRSTAAPTIAGQDRANPVSQILSAARLLEHTAVPATASRVRHAVGTAFSDRAIELDAAGSPVRGTGSATAAILARLPA